MPHCISTVLTKLRKPLQTTLHGQKLRGPNASPLEKSSTCPVSIELQASLFSGQGGNGSLWLLLSEPKTTDGDRLSIERGTEVSLSDSGRGEKMLGRISGRYRLERNWVVFSMEINQDEMKMGFLGVPHQWAHICILGAIRRRCFHIFIRHYLPPPPLSSRGSPNSRIRRPSQSQNSRKFRFIPCNSRVKP